MAGRRRQFAPNQEAIDFPGADADASSVFRYQMTRLREQLAAIPLAATGLTGLRWNQVRELVMAIKSYELAGRQPQLLDLLRTSRLSRDQWYVAREHALGLGLISSTRQYLSRARAADVLAIDVEAIARLAHQPRGPTKSDQHRIAPNSTELVRPSPTSTKEVTTRAALELPINSSTAAASACARTSPTGDRQAGGEVAAAAAEEIYEIWKTARPIANRLLKILSPGGLARCGPDRRDWIIKVAILAARLGEQWIAPAFERLRYSPAKSPQGLMAAILDDECQRLGTRLNRELAKIRVPQDLLQRAPCESD